MGQQENYWGCTSHCPRFRSCLSERRLLQMGCVLVNIFSSSFMLRCFWKAKRLDYSLFLGVFIQIFCRLKIDVFNHCDCSWVSHHAFHLQKGGYPVKQNKHAKIGLLNLFKNIFQIVHNITRSMYSITFSSVLSHIFVLGFSCALSFRPFLVYTVFAFNHCACITSYLKPM